MSREVPFSLVNHLMQLANTCPEKLYQYAMDARFLKNDNHLSDWESREKNSTVAIMNAYAYVLDKVLTKEHYTVDDILNIHKICTAHVRGNLDLCDSPGGCFRIHDLETKFEISQPNTVDAFSRNASKAGIEELAAYCFDNQDYSMFSQKAQAIFKNAQTKEKLTTFLLLKTPLLGLFSKKYPLYFYGTNNDSSNRKLHTLVKNTLEMLYQKLGSTTTDHDKIKEIVIAIQKLERIHPFPDANCRTFCVVLLNGLLMQQGFLPAIIFNPNRFDGYSINELVKMVEVGIILTNQLTDPAKKPPVNINELCEVADIPYFSEITTPAETGESLFLQKFYAMRLIQKIQILPVINHFLSSTTLTDENRAILEKIDGPEKLELLLEFLKNNHKSISLDALSALFTHVFKEPFDTVNFLQNLSLVDNLDFRKEIFENFMKKLKSLQLGVADNSPSSSTPSP